MRNGDGGATIHARGRADRVNTTSIAAPHDAAAPPPAAGTAALRPRAQLSPCVGRGGAIGHHGEVLQGAVRDAAGRLRRALVSLPCPRFRASATFRPDAGPLRVSPADKVKALRAAALLLERLGLEGQGGLLTVESGIPQAWGLGSSTADVVAALRAVARAFRARITPDELARLAVQAEVASDGTMFGEAAVLFAQREGVVLEHLGGALPPMELLGFNADPAGAGIDTLALAPAEYTAREVEAFRRLVELLRQALRTRDAALVGFVSGASARVNQRFLPTPGFRELERIAADAGAAGVQVAHSGVVAGLLFDAADPGVRARIDRARARLREALAIGETWRFRTGGGAPRPEDGEVPAAPRRR